MHKKRIVIAGGSGFLGLSLCNHLTKAGYEVTVLSRNRPKLNSPFNFVQWDGRSLGEWQKAIDGVDAIVNLAGRSVDCRKTPDHVDEILRSRVESTLVLGQAMQDLTTVPSVWVQMSTAHIYGDPPNLFCTENSPFGHGLAPDVGKAWEKQFRDSIRPEQRGIILRTSFVIGKNRGAGGGALSRLRFVARIGLGGRIGSGKQGMSWIHESDMNRIIERAISDSSMHGAYIASSPKPVSQVEFMKCLRRSVKIPIGLPATETMVRLGARLLLNTDPELALYGRYVIPQRLIDSGFSFRFPELADALTDLI